MKSLSTEFLNEFKKLNGKLNNYIQWHSIIIDHRIYKDFGIVRQGLIDQIGVEKGEKIKCVYIYLLPNRKRPLYIGKSKNLIGRVMNHYKEIYDSNTGFPKWKKFWKKHKFRMKVYYLVIETEELEVDEPLRTLVESLLIAKHKPLSIEV